MAEAHTELPAGSVVVTGGGGFLGSALLWELNRHGYENLLVVDEFGTGDKWKHLRGLRFLDVLSPADFLHHFTRDPALAATVGTVFHLGACSATTERDMDYLLRNNYAYTRDLCAAARRAGCRFVYASSAATYGNATGHQDEDPATLDDLRPLHPYGYSKHLFDLHAHRGGFLGEIVGLKYFNVFGPHEDHKGEMRSMVRKAWEQVRAEGRLRLFRSHRPEYGDGEQERDFLYVKDAVRMTLHLAATPAAGGLYNLGSGQARTWRALARAVFAALGREERIEFIEMPPEIRDQYQYSTRAEIGRLRATGYTAPVTPLEDAVADYLQNYLEPGRSLGE